MKEMTQPTEVTGRNFNPILFISALLAPGIIMPCLPLVYDSHGAGFDVLLIHLAVLVISSVLASGFCSWQLTLCCPSLSTGIKALLGILHFIAFLVATIFMGYIGGALGATLSSLYS
jgi:hypothetical protein